MASGDLSRLYTIRFSGSDLKQKNEIWKVICTKWLQRYIEPDDVVVDVACGYGEFINNIEAGRKVAIDLNKDSQIYLDRDVEFVNCKATQLSKVVQEADIVFASNFLEHLPDKAVLEEFLLEVFSTLKPGGKFIVMGPNLRYLPGQYWDFYDHELGLTHLSLCEVLKMKGFKISRCIGRFLPYTTKSSLPTHTFLVRMYLRMPILWRLFGKQFIVIAEKK